MSRWIHRIFPWALAIAAISPAWAQTQTVSGNDTAVPAINATIQRVQSQALRTNEESLQRRLDIAERANNVFTLFASELAWQSGQALPALTTDILMIGRTQDPEVAQRAMEMALDAHAIPQAEAILTSWKTLNPADSSAQRRMQWFLALAKGDIQAVAADFDFVLADINEYQARRLFLQMAELGLLNQPLVNRMYTAVHSAAKRFPDMPEAMIADAIYSALSNHRQDAVSALNRLAQADADMQPATLLTLSLISQRQPQVLASFFRQTDITALSPMWQKLYIDILMIGNRLPEAYAQIQSLLQKNSSAALYLQAAFLSSTQNAPLTTTLNYLQHAYDSGNTDEQSRAAFLSSMSLLEKNKIVAARAWANKIHAPAYRFDKAVLLASIEAEDKHWTATQQQLHLAEKQHPQNGRYFDQNDLSRLQILLLTNSTTPQHSLPQINHWITQAQAAGQNERLASLLYQRGLMYADTLHQPQKAISDFRHYLTLQPDSAIGLNALGYTLLSLPKSGWQEAQQLIESAYQLDSQSSSINDSLGWVYFLNGDAERALPYLQFAFTHDPEPEVAAHLGEVLWQLGRQDEARQIWHQGLQKNARHPVLLATLKRLNVSVQSVRATTGKPTSTPAPIPATGDKSKN